MKRPNPYGVRLTSDDKTVIAGLKRRLGLNQTSDVIRLALRTLDARGIASNEEAPMYRLQLTHAGDYIVRGRDGR